MSVIRSPPVTCNDGNRDSIEIASGVQKAGGSHPDLRKLAEFSLDRDSPNKITVRPKRKETDDNLVAKFENFQTKIESMILGMARTQSENLSKIAKDVSSIKDQINQIKITTDHLSVEQDKLKLELVNLSDFKTNIEQKVDILDTDLKTIKSTIQTIPQFQQSFTYEEFISETQERAQREKNIIILGITELQSTIPEVRREHDTNEVNKILKKALPESAVPVKTIRLVESLITELKDNEYQNLEHLLRVAVKKNKTLKTKIQNPPQSDWINKEITAAIRRKNQLWSIHKNNTHDENLKRDFLTVKNEVTSQIQNTKSRYYHKAFNSCKVPV
ncbi:hypothetical protein B5X24_HaOG203453 [Helicoverpa armigera]|uniref:Uncharacterized protein n=1 Tax=Helicoverpa armigera TaxID=29058 RepID=A0A2W1BUR5_HELAM|nr:hypothetical protein B5X24_HaOG203453 [Helicoverpa armigera]